MLIHLVQGLVVDSCEQGNESSGSMNSRKFLDEMSDYYLLKKVCALCSLLFEENLPQGHFTHFKSHMYCAGIETSTIWLDVCI